MQIGKQLTCENHYRDDNFSFGVLLYFDGHTYILDFRIERQQLVADSLLHL